MGMRPDRREKRVMHLYPAYVLGGPQVKTHLFDSQKCWCGPKVEFTHPGEFSSPTRVAAYIVHTEDPDGT